MWLVKKIVFSFLCKVPKCLLGLHVLFGTKMVKYITAFLCDPIVICGVINA